jgi:hypothetical protein
VEAKLNFIFMSINKLLYELYASKWEKLCEAMELNSGEGKAELANPLMLYINDEKDFMTADVKVMLFGQNTGNWYGFDTCEGSLSEIMQSFTESFDNREGSIGKYYSMGQGMNKFINDMNTRYSDKKIRYVWNNIVKIGFKSSGTPPDRLYQIEKEHFAVIKDEITIIKPDIILFLTGLNYDGKIKINFGELSFVTVTSLNDIRKLAKIDMPEFPFVKCAFRTYHPNEMLFVAGGVARFMEAIINEIKL